MTTTKTAKIGKSKIKSFAHEHGNIRGFIAKMPQNASNRIY